MYVPIAQLPDGINALNLRLSLFCACFTGTARLPNAEFDCSLPGGPPRKTTIVHRQADVKSLNQMRSLTQEADSKRHRAAFARETVLPQRPFASRDH
jgi:hypothetical protein